MWGMFTNLYPRACFSFVMKLSNSVFNVLPFGKSIGSPLPTKSETTKSSISLPLTLRSFLFNSGSLTSSYYQIFRQKKEGFRLQFLGFFSYEGEFAVAVGNAGFDGNALVRNEDSLKFEKDAWGD